MKLPLLFVLLTAFLVHTVKAVECPDGQQWFEHENVCAKVSLETDSWRVADTECRMSRGRSLHLSVEDGRDDSELLEWLRRNRHIYQTNSYYWTGASIPALTLPSYYQRCGSGHKFRGVCYDVVMSRKTWTEASSYCTDSGGQLAHVDDVETSKAVGRAFREVTAQIPQFAREVFDGYWIDGKMNKGSSQFIDQFGDSFNYTNMAPSYQSNILHGQRCREVSVVAFENSFNSTYIKASDCEQKMPSVCQFSLGGLSSGESYFEKASKQHNKQKNGLAEDQGADIDYSLLFTPSHVSSCEDIVILSKLAGEMKENLLKMDEKMLTDVTLLDVFIDARTGHFILSNKPTEGSKERASFKLTYCNLEATRAKLEQTEKITERDSAVQLYLMMFSWGSFDVIDQDIDGKEIAKASPLRLSNYNQFQIDNNFTFMGPCVFVDAVQGQWHTSPCKRFLPYICEYTPYGARKVDEKEKTKPSSVISKRLDSLLIELDGQNQTFHQLDSSRLLAAVELMREIVSAGKQQNSYLLSFRSSSFVELDALLQKTLPVVHSLQVLSGATIVDTENLAIQAVSTLAENVADKFTKEQTNNGDMKSVDTLTYENPSSEIRIVLLDETITDGTATTNVTFKPHMIERSTSISVFPDQSKKLFTGSNGDRAAVIFAVYKFEGDQSPANAQMAPSFIASGDGKTHVKLNQLNDAQWRVGTPIISATLRIAGQSIPVPVQFTLPRFSFTDVEMVNRSEMCSYLTYTDQGSVWSDTGCFQQHEQDELYRCSCNHTTDFAVLLLVYVPTDKFHGHSFPMFVLSMIGESLSVIALVSTLVAYITLRSFLKSDRFIVHMNLAAALLVTHLILITSRLCVGPTQHDETSSIDEVTCTAFALLLHFSLLSSFCWMLVEGYILYKKILIVLARETQIIRRRHYVLGWSFPVFVVIFSYVICQITGVPYNDQRCWLSVENGVLWSVAGPAIVMLTVNFTIMIRVLCVAVATQKRRYRRRIGSVGSGVVFRNMWRRDVKVAARGLIFLAPLLGISWVFGFLAGVNVVCAYTFIFCNAFQGLYLFIFYVVLNPEVRSAWQEKKLSQARNLLNKSDLPDVSGSQRKHWFRRLSTSLFSRISFSPPSSGNNTPTSEDIKSNSVKDFVGVTLPSRPSSAKSIGDRVRAAASSMTVLREKAEHVHPKIGDIEFSEEEEEEWECVSDCPEIRKHHPEILDVSCESDTDIPQVNVQKLPRFFQNPLPSASDPHTNHLPAIKITPDTGIGDIMMSGIVNPVFATSEPCVVKKTSINSKTGLSGELRTKTARPKVLKTTPKKETKLVCNSPMCRECNSKPLTGARNKQRPYIKKAATKSKIRRPVTTGATKRDRTKHGQRRQQKLKRQAWPSTKPAHLSLTEALDLQADQASYFQSLQTLPNDKRPQSTGSHDSGIVVTP